MTADVQEKRPELKLSCRESNLVIKLMPLQKKFDKMNEEEVAAIKHYLYCKECRNKGLANIIGTNLTCIEAILVWAEHAKALWQSCAPMIFFNAKTLIEIHAVEHVWGKYEWKNQIGGCGWDRSTGCREQPCMALSYYWASVPMSSSAGDGPEGVIHLFPFLIETFLKENWPLDKLLQVQEKRVTQVLKDVRKGKVTVSSGHYHSANELIAEIREHFSSLKKLLISFQTRPASNK